MKQSAMPIAREIEDVQRGDWSTKCVQRMPAQRSARIGRFGSVFIPEPEPMPFQPARRLSCPVR